MPRLSYHASREEHLVLGEEILRVNPDLRVEVHAQPGAGLENSFGEKQAARIERKLRKAGIPQRAAEPVDDYLGGRGKNALVRFAYST